MVSHRLDLSSQLLVGACPPDDRVQRDSVLSSAIEFLQIEPILPADFEDNSPVANFRFSLFSDFGNGT